MAVESVYRSENKYVIDLAKSSALQQKFDVVLQPDAIQGNNFYMVRSVYFDSINNIDFNTKLAGTEVRKKIRLRIYRPDSDEAKLEMKQKIGDAQHKLSMMIKRKDAIALIQGDTSVLVNYFSKYKDAVLFYTTMQLGCYKPVTMIEYDRKAYTYPAFQTRITFDTNIRESESNFNLFDPEPVYTTVLNQEVVLEVKYNEKLIGIVSDILKPYHLNRVAVSKYVMGRKAFYEFNY